MKQRKSPAQLAQLIIANINEWEEVRQKSSEQPTDRPPFKVHRASFELKHLIRMSNNANITSMYMEYVKLNLAEHGWMAFDNNGNLYVLKDEPLKNWPRLGTKPRIPGSEYDKLING